MTTITLSDAGKAVSALNEEMAVLYAEAFELSKQQNDAVRRMREEMQHLSDQQMKVAVKLVALEKAMHTLLKDL